MLIIGRAESLPIWCTIPIWCVVMYYPYMVCSACTIPIWCAVMYYPYMVCSDVLSLYGVQ